jgi:predicted regulator of Ras-like GTPase activity (Roadblock/LC7/MglB family)
MKEVLHQINGVPEVIGSLVCDRSGRVLGHSFPPLFDSSIVQRAAALLTDSSLSLQNDQGVTGLLDLRYSDGRIIARELEGGLLMVLCTKAVNLAMLTISLNVAKNKLEELFPSTTVAAAKPVAGGTKASTDMVLAASQLESSAASRGFNELGMVGINHVTARQIGDRYQCGAIKKLVISHGKSGVSGTFPVMLINDETNRYDGQIILSPAIEKKLGATAGEQLAVTPAS